MAVVYRNVKGRGIADFLANEDYVQTFLEDTTFRMAVAAEELLLEHIDTGAATIEVEHGDVDWYVILSDEAGQKHALSIEFGRAAGVDPETGVRWGEMEGLFILTRATGIPKKQRGKVHL